MNFLEAMEQAQNNDKGVYESDKEVWFRPLSYRGTGEALCVDDNKVCIVPRSRGAIPYIPVNVSIMSGNWEVVSPDKVYEELKKF